MTIGTGIFLAALLWALIYGARAATLHRKWKLVGKVAAISTAGLVGLAALFFLWSYVSNQPPPLAVSTELAGVKLGMSPTDVTIALGKPDTETDPDVEKGGTTFRYIYSNPNRAILFSGADKYHARATIVCTSGIYAKLLGFDTMTDEKLLIERLGKPSNVSISSDGLEKIDSYTHWKAAFFIAKNSVERMCITQSGAVAFTHEHLSPEAQKAADQKAAQAAAKEIADAKAKAEIAASRHTATVKRSGSDLTTPRVPKADPCAPGLSEAERLHRLSEYGKVRQTSAGDYEAGGHTVWYGGNYLITCN